MPLTHYKSALSICHEGEERKGEKKFVSRALEISLAFDRNVSFIQGRPGGWVAAGASAPGCTGAQEKRKMKKEIIKKEKMRAKNFCSISVIL